MNASEFEAWFVGKDFTADWTSHHFEVWDQVFKTRRGQVSRILEVGSYEGRSAIFFLNYFPNASLTCIDIFGIYDYAKVWPDIYEKLPVIESTFDRNVAEFSGRVNKIKGDSKAVLRTWSMAFRIFDLIYIDGDHGSESTFLDCSLAWRLLRPGGLMIIDDYEFDAEHNLSDRPKPGIDRFMQESSGTYREIHRGYQLILEKEKMSLPSTIGNLFERAWPRR